MSLVLYGHPFSSYTQKALVALYENGIAFEFRCLGPDKPEHTDDCLRLWPLAKFPLLRDGQRSVVETSIIIEYLGGHHPGPVQLIPADPGTALDVRLMDRFFDNYIMTPVQKIVGDCLRPAERRDAHGVGEARALLDKAYTWLEKTLSGREWAAGAGFSLADCAAAPSLFYADWVHEIPAVFTNLRSYRARLLARPSIARAVDEARPYRHLFPPGAPDRD